MNNYKLIKLSSDIIIVSYEQPIQGNKVYSKEPVFGSGGNKEIIFEYDKRINYQTDFGHKVNLQTILYSSNPSHNLPFITLTDEIAEKIGWDNTLSVLINHCNILINSNKEKESFCSGIYAVLGRINTLKTTQSLNTNKYSEEDIRLAFHAGSNYGYDIVADTNKKSMDIEEYIQSLNKPKEWNVIGTLENNTFIVKEIS